MNYTKYSKVEQESSDSSKRGSQDDSFSDNESGLPLSQQPRSLATRLFHVAKRTWWLVGPFLWLLSLVVTWTIASAATKSPYDISRGLDTELEPLKSQIEMYTTTFSSDLDWDENGILQRVSRPGSKQFVGDPSPEIDANWEHITNGKCLSYVIVNGQVILMRSRRCGHRPQRQRRPDGHRKDVPKARWIMVRGHRSFPSTTLSQHGPQGAAC
ncbi:hypothetical protein VHEMI01211 [[Torrubiella] hemipterigena]|uniref:Uncharacterized protein n=1 Tax=[Torrubiella] hemipterigena TaxID=1531966 RepID=A0A0A1SSG9_9HYPO|nr:hypothetical protein VHEMI01211 [[Torrubiella] hemipterigena]